MKCIGSWERDDKYCVGLIRALGIFTGFKIAPGTRIKIHSWLASRYQIPPDVRGRIWGVQQVERSDDRVSIFLISDGVERVLHLNRSSKCVIELVEAI